MRPMGAQRPLRAPPVPVPSAHSRARNSPAQTRPATVKAGPASIPQRAALSRTHPDSVCPCATWGGGGWRPCRSLLRHSTLRVGGRWPGSSWVLRGPRDLCGRSVCRTWAGGSSGVSLSRTSGARVGSSRVPAQTPQCALSMGASWTTQRGRGKGWASRPMSALGPPASRAGGLSSTARETICVSFVSDNPVVSHKGRRAVLEDPWRLPLADKGPNCRRRA
ncbi:hypothetical protein C8Q78DRAFT_646010 [Trametes maxima]|nr:hypothetical protein C8Q78DRAFT_646010 [Trametes maxima]